MISKSKKSAIALVSLVLIIMILLMISGIVTYVSYDIIKQSKETVFAKNSQAISDAVEEYYAVNGDIPVLTGGVAISASEYETRIESLKGDTFSKILLEEITKNNDENATFYEIDITKIGIEDMKYGIKKDSNDIYLVSSDSYTVYYYPGTKINGDIYFSTSNIINKDS